MKVIIYRKIIELTNNAFISSVIKKFATSSVSKKIIPSYRNVFNIPHNEIEQPLTSFKSLHDFFTRTIPANLRPLNSSERSVLSPVDGKIESYGILHDKNYFTVKGKKYDVIELVGKKNSELFKNGSYIVCYLSPANYHRIHSPITCTKVSLETFGNTSYPVNKLGLLYGKDPLSKNYRKMMVVKNDDNQHIGVAMVGAMFVNSIEVDEEKTSWEKGEEMAYFTFGSTVILLFPENSVEFAETVQKDATIRYGEKLATML